ncbi:unnamed protein product [Linum trigynum]|uniref:Uncharacterized protein n=1 Tax=Linum trigynum TaxID=586398 RepID=A0AAV2EUD7_9ROSI
MAMAGEKVSRKSSIGSGKMVMMTVALMLAVVMLGEFQLGRADDPVNRKCVKDCLAKCHSTEDRCYCLCITKCPGTIPPASRTSQCLND